MGQIIGGAAKPKRCNLNELSQLGTPAAGEHILVSSDNSMNAAGQGNFDCYIVGNGRDAATALELKSVVDVSQLEAEVDELDERVFGANEVVFISSDYVANAGLIDYADGIFRSNSVYGTKNAHVLIPFSAYRGRTLKVTGDTAHYKNNFAFLTSDALVSGSEAPFCVGTSCYDHNSNTSIEITVPSDCVYLYVYSAREGVDSFPSLVSILAVDGEVVLKDQGIENAGKYMAVGSNGKVAPVSIPPIPSVDAVRKELIKKLYLGADIAALGSLGTGWSGDVANGFTHASGNTAPLVLNSTRENMAYLITLNCSSTQENIYLVSIGDGPLIDTYNGQSLQQVGIISDGGAVKITPSADFSGTITVKCQEIVSENDAVEELTITVNNVEAGNMEEALTAFWNVAVGPDTHTLGKAVSASRNIAIGIDSLRELETGTRNIGVGTFTMSQMKNGKGNIAIGADAIFLRRNGNDNVAIGRAAMGAGTVDVNDNVLIGRSAGTNTSGDNNVAIGPVAGYNATSDGIFIGEFSGYSCTGVKNIVIGRRAGYASGTRAGNWNTIVGPSAAFNNGVSKSTAIGFQAEATKSSQNVIGSADSQETKVFGDLVVHGTDGIDRKIVFNQDNTISWEAVSE